MTPQFAEVHTPPVRTHEAAVVIDSVDAQLLSKHINNGILSTQILPHISTADTIAPITPPDTPFHNVLEGTGMLHDNAVVDGTNSVLPTTTQVQVNISAAGCTDIHASNNNGDPTLRLKQWLHNHAMALEAIHHDGLMDISNDGLHLMGVDSGAHPSSVSISHYKVL